MMIQMLLPSIGVKAYANKSHQIINKMEIISKSVEYYPGESIRIKVDWSIPDDTPAKQYKAGDKFSMTIPKGLIAGFNEIKSGELVTGKVVGDKIEFVFTEKIEGLVNRSGGNLRFELSHKIDNNFVPIEFTTDENGVYEHEKGHINNGLYILKEVEAPEGYKKMEPMDIRIIYDPENSDGAQQVFEFEIENELKPISVKGSKKWLDKDEKEIESQEDITVSLFA